MKWIKFLTVTLMIALTVQLASAADLDDQDDVRTVEVVGMDNLRYDVEEIEAKPGETLRIVLEVESNLPAQSMQHNIAILDLDVDVSAFVNASVMARDNEYIAPDMEGQVIAHTEMIPGGETTEVEFTVPETPGEYEFVCTFPGHYAAGMVGVLRVVE